MICKARSRPPTTVEPTKLLYNLKMAFIHKAETCSWSFLIGKIYSNLWQDHTDKPTTCVTDDQYNTVLTCTYTCIRPAWLIQNRKIIDKKKSKGWRTKASVIEKLATLSEHKITNTLEVQVCGWVTHPLLVLHNTQVAGIIRSLSKNIKTSKFMQYNSCDYRNQHDTGSSLLQPV
jgi:hypothetical protein